MHLVKRKTKWRMKVLYLDSCNCDWGCPCQFNARPTNGSCFGVGGVHIIEGNYGDVNLGKLNLLLALAYPKAVHEGHGRASYYVDDRTTDEQFDALSRIVTGEAGGDPFEFYSKTLDDYQAPRRARIAFSSKGIRSEIVAEGVAEARLEPMRNPVTGQVHRAVIELPGGVEANRMDQASLRRGFIDDRYLKFESSGTYGSISKATWSGP